jgi:hypothetical protein
MSNNITINSWLARESKSKKMIDIRGMKGSVDVYLVTNPFYQALIMARLDHTRWKTIREAIEARLERQLGG